MADTRAGWQPGRLLRREGRRMLTQPGYAFLLFLAPLLAWGLLNGIVAEPQVRAVPFQVVDLDRTPASRDLAYRLGTSSTLDVRVQHQGTDAALAAVRESSAFGYLVIEHGFSEQLAYGLPQTVPAYVNQQSYMMGTLLGNELVRFIIERSLRETAALFMTQGELKEQAQARVVPIQTQRAVFGNQWLNYRSFLLGALQLHVWHVLVVLVTMVSVGHEFRDDSVNDWSRLSGGRLVPALLGKLLLPGVVLFSWVLLAHIHTLDALSLPWTDRLGTLAVVSLVVQLFYQAVALVVILLIRNLRRALSLAAVYTLPAFAFIGVTFPVAAMNPLARFWQELLPVGTLVRLQDSIVHMGGLLDTAITAVAPIFWVTLALLPPALWMLHSTLNQTDGEPHTP
ncbi:ABC transporter permease [Saccharospirillum salsuginis]|uniref:Multidrug ABC transporter permease n=1 Tax=Saccharospirillum salsuginis TaxID=418750 RepID=A0A918N9K7_9GAMM|nr:ABC transporter permease [Saccharospirillum salsuginis]GGX53921.1 multidrug ABC transporter permease [Saccharospirillum salsuginis]